MFSMHTGQIIGPLLGSFVIAANSRYLFIFLFQVMTILGYLISVLTLPHLGPAEKSFSMRLSVREGIIYATKEPIIRGCLWLDFCMTFFAIPIVLFPEFTVVNLNAGPEIYGWLLSSISIGGVAASLISGTFTRTKKLGRILLCASTGWLLLVLFLSFSSSVRLALFITFLMGAADVIALTAQQTIVQLEVTDKMQGRIAGIQMIVGMGGPQLGGARAGLFSNLFSPSMVMFMGVPLAFTAICADRSGIRSLIRYKRKEI